MPPKLSMLQHHASVVANTLPYLQQALQKHHSEEEVAQRNIVLASPDIWNDPQQAIPLCRSHKHFTQISNKLQRLQDLVTNVE
ncbi:MAG: hypothetical protein EP343_18825 [Deltaproteobacteria bacterium]|nr:MAG: hypothetical protein EP343_18825 [Deltaproteobacteria bacterium]